MEVQNNERINNTTFIERFTSKDFLEFCNDTIPSISLISLIIFSLYISNQSPCFSQFPKFFHTIMFIYLAFLIRGLIRLMLVYFNKISETWAKISFNASDGILFL